MSIICDRACFAELINFPQYDRSWSYKLLKKSKTLEY